MMLKSVLNNSYNNASAVGIVPIPQRAGTVTCKVRSLQKLTTNAEKQQ